MKRGKKERNKEMKKERKKETNKQTKEKGGKEGSWPALQEVGFFSYLVYHCLRAIQWP